MRFNHRAAPWLACLLLGWLGSGASLAHAQADAATAAGEDASHCQAERHVTLSLADELEPDLQRDVSADLASELAPRGLTVCVTKGSGGGTALAEVQVARREGSRFSIEVFDRTTDKRVSRDVSLARIPNNGRALAIAIAIDELLRASWAELALRVRQGPPTPAAAATTKSELPRTTSTRSAPRIGLEASYLGSAEHFHALGAGVTFDALLFSIGWIEGRSGLTRALPRNVTEGELSVWGGQASLTLGACLVLGANRARACLGARSELDVLRFRGTSEGDAVGRSLTKSVVLGAVVTKLSVPLRGRWSLCLSAGAGTSLLGARVTDGARTLTRIDGLVLLGSLGVGADL